MRDIEMIFLTVNLQTKNPRSFMTDPKEKVFLLTHPTHLRHSCQVRNMAEAEGYPSFGGYDEDFVSEVDEDWQCPVCYFALKDAVQTEECGHRFCRKCLEGHFLRLAFLAKF